MDLNYTPEDIAFRKQVRTWLEQNLPKKEIRTLEDRLAWRLTDRRERDLIRGRAKALRPGEQPSVSNRPRTPTAAPGAS